MKSILIKAASAALVLSMVLSTAACAKKGGKGGHGGKKITADTPWFNGETINAELGYDKEREKDYVYSQILGTLDDKIFVLTSGNYKMPTGPNVDWENFNYKDYQISVVSVIDRVTHETVNSIDLTKAIGVNDYVNSAYIENGIVTLTADSYDETTYEQIGKEFDLDPETGNILETRTLKGGAAPSSMYSVGDYKVGVAYNWNEDHSYMTLVIRDPDGNEKKADVKEGNKDVYGISGIFPISEDRVMFPADTDNGTTYYEIDLKTGELTKADSNEYSWLTTFSLYNTFLASDGSIYSSSPAGISKVDMKNKSVEEVFNYSWCGIDRSTLTNLQIADVKEDSFLLSGEIYNSLPYSDNYDWNNAEFILFELKKADKNPHVGKTILELYASYGYTDQTVSKTISKFNDTNGKYFIEVTDRYKSDADYNYSEINSDDELNKAQNDYLADMSNKLAMDILNGEGPDMFLDVSYLGQLNSVNYLTDLSPIVSDLDSSKYFTNVLELSKVDGKLFNLPVSFTVDGIQTDAKYAGKSGKGFTTDEYEAFLKDTLNGEDIITTGQAHYFATLFNGMNDVFIKNGKADFSGPEFEALAKFVKDNVTESSTSWDEMNDDEEYYEGVVIDGMYEEEDVGPAIYGGCYNFRSYFYGIKQLKGASAVLGIPSADGRGPMISSYTSIAISAQASNPDACKEFVKLLLSDEVQNELALKGQFTLNRELFKEHGKKAVEYFNKNGIEEYYYDDTPKSKFNFTDEYVDALEKTILDCSKLNSEDSAINLVLVEEMPAYFSGQKELSDVIKIAQDRVQKVLDERG